jgi:hypothetical protein
LDIISKILIVHGVVEIEKTPVIGSFAL